MMISVMSLGWGSAFAADGSGATNRIAPRIGVYDSRAVAVAYGGSRAFNEKMAPLYAEQKKAQAAGDEKKLKELREQGRALQVQAHKQAFSTAPVDDILASIKPQMAEIIRTSAVQVVVSKWDTAALAKYKNAEQVDVTMALVEALQPNDRQRKFAIDIQKHPPISLKEAEEIRD